MTSQKEKELYPKWMLFTACTFRKKAFKDHKRKGLEELGDAQGSSKKA